MYCPQCGASNLEDDAFCQLCKSPLGVREYRDPVFYAENEFWNRIGNALLISGLLSMALFLLMLFIHWFF